MLECETMLDIERRWPRQLEQSRLGRCVPHRASEPLAVQPAGRRRYGLQLCCFWAACASSSRPVPLAWEGVPKAASRATIVRNFNVQQISTWPISMFGAPALQRQQSADYGIRGDRFLRRLAGAERGRLLRETERATSTSASLSDGWQATSTGFLRTHPTRSMSSGRRAATR